MLWSTFERVAKVLQTSADVGKPWSEFIPLILERLCSFVKVCASTCVKNALAQVRVLSPSVPLEKLVEGAESHEYVDRVKAEEDGVKVLATELASRIQIVIPEPSS